MSLPAENAHPVRVKSPSTSLMSGPGESTLHLILLGDLLVGAVFTEEFLGVSAVTLLLGAAVERAIRCFTLLEK